MNDEPDMKINSRNEMSMERNICAEEMTHEANARYLEACSQFDRILEAENINCQYMTCAVM